MANWHGAARSNYVKIKDEAGLRNALRHFDVKIWTNSDGLFAFGGDSDSGGWPSITTDDDDEEIEFSPIEQICPFMHEDQVLVMMQSGHESQRYVDGRAEAYNSKGEWVSIALNNIYDLAKKHFGIDPGEAAY